MQPEKQSLRVAHTETVRDRSVVHRKETAVEAAQHAPLFTPDLPIS